jgi:hypothetical protein
MDRVLIIYEVKDYEARKKLHRSHAPAWERIL